jgi:hypothetical protein
LKAWGCRSAQGEGRAAAAMIQAAAMAEKVATYRHPKVSAVRLAGELNKKPMNGATLDELLVRIKTQLTKLGPILGLEVMPPHARLLTLQKRLVHNMQASDSCVQYRGY